MRTKHIFVIWNCIRIKGEASREYYWFKSQVVVLLTVPRRFVCCSSSLFVHRWFHMNGAFVLSLFVSYSSFFCCCIRDCDIS